MSSSARLSTIAASPETLPQTPHWWYLPVLAVIIGMAALGAATALLLEGVEPFATWYYNFAWYPVLLIGDGIVALTGGAGRGRRGEFLLLGRKSFLVTVLAWSAVVWLFYELFNFRLQNWYYINVPADRFGYWSGTLIAFATVLPAVFVAEGILSGLGVGERVRWKRFEVTSALIAVMRITGVIMLALVMFWPGYFFPLVWGATMLLVEPENYRRSRDHSLLGDLEKGEPGRLLRLLLGGAAIGFIWELLNIHARAKWIYTVPFLEDARFFEMPLPGFFGFPPFAVECFILWQSIVLAGFAVPRMGITVRARKRKRIAAALLAVMFSIGVLLGMEQLTVDSRKPEMEHFSELPAQQLRAHDYDMFKLAQAAPAHVAAIAESSLETAAQYIELARLATLRGLGSDNVKLLQALGINSLQGLAAADWRVLEDELEAMTGRDIVAARVRVWIRGARQAVSQG
ncbi:MAG TPA: hypothetical protein VFO52_10135 [Longimicrobiales bacterium]|nr:hypothetical protein [Longimicrobiales bacterium]